MNPIKTVSLIAAFIAATAVATTGSLSAKKSAEGKNDLVFAKISIDQIGSDQLNIVLQSIKHQLAIEADADLILLTTKSALSSTTIAYKILPVTPVPDQLFTIRKAHDDLLANLEGDVIAKAGRLAVIQATTPYLKQLTWHKAILPLTASVILARQAANDNFANDFAFSTDTNAVVDSVNGQRWHTDLTALTSINRYSRGSEIAQAQKYLEETLKALPGMEVTTQEFSMGTTKSWNIIGKLTGTTRPNEWIIVGAHYDSISQSPSTNAPGAEDNGSGTAGMLELARVFSVTRPEASILFIGFSGEEQGLKGSYAHVAKIIADGHKDKIKAVLTMDMIGYTKDADLDCLLESDQRGSALFPILSAAAQQYTSLRIVTSLNPWGSDHVPYIEKGIPSLLVIENDWNEYPAYHKTTDKIELVTVAMAEQTLRMQAAVISQMTGAIKLK